MDQRDVQRLGTAACACPTSEQHAKAQIGGAHRAWKRAIARTRAWERAVAACCSRLAKVSREVTSAM